MRDFRNQLANVLADGVKSISVIYEYVNSFSVKATMRGECTLKSHFTHNHTPLDGNDADEVRCKTRLDEMF